MSSIARVIFLVELTARMRFRYSRICAPIRFRLPGCACAGCRSAPLLDDLLLLGRLGLGSRVLLLHLAGLETVGAGALEELVLERADLGLQGLLGLLLELARLAD